MRINRVERYWKFSQPLTEGCLIQCPECKGWNTIDDWQEVEVDCELCGTHDAISCPSCFEAFDHVYCDDETFPVVTNGIIKSVDG